MEDGFIILKALAFLIGGVVVLSVIYKIIMKTRNNRRYKEALKRVNKEIEFKKAQAKEYIDSVVESRSLFEVESSMILNKRETAYWEEQSALYESRASGWKKISSGVLCVTNERVIFNGTRDNRTIKMMDVLAVDIIGDSLISVTSDTRKKSMVFSTMNSAILKFIVEICAKVKDPKDLSNVEFS